VVVAALVFAALAAVFGLGIAAHLGPAGFDDPATNSGRADSALAAHGQDTGLFILVRAGGGPSASARDTVAAVEREVRGEPLVSDVSVAATGPTRPGSATAPDAYLAVRFQPAPIDRRDAAATVVQQRLAGRPGIAVGGTMAVTSQLSDTVEHDVQRAELFGLPLLLLLSLLVFRGLIAALLPPLIGGLTILGTFLALRLLDSSVSVSVLALNVVTALGLGLAVDYSLFMVSRYREEIARRGPTFDALRATMLTAGRTVLYSALTIAAVMATLMLFPQSFLFSMGFGGCLVALLAAISSLVVLPAVLSMLGGRVNALAPARLRRGAERDARVTQTGMWYRLSVFVMARAGRTAVVVGLVLIAIALPFVHVQFVPVDGSVLPVSTGSRQVDDALRADDLLNQTNPIVVVLSGGSRAAAEHTAARLAQLPDAAGVGSVRQFGADQNHQVGYLVDVVSRGGPYSHASQQLVTDIRGVAGQALVTGPTAQFIDLKASLLSHLPLLIALVAAATILALFLMTGSLALGLKTLLMNLVTFAAVLGILVRIFQYGSLARLLGFTSQGALEATSPMLLFAAVFALSTDYGVFLLARVKEARDNGAADGAAVAIGQERTGRPITAAALLFCFAVGSFATSSIVGVKETTLGIAIAVIIDATLVRALLMPALMHLLGAWNWWAPPPLARLYAWLNRSQPAGQHPPAETSQSGDVDRPANHRVIAVSQE
jgi:RND superfamily putative drug exporter